MKYFRINMMIVLLVVVFCSLDHMARAELLAQWQQAINGEPAQ